MIESLWDACGFQRDCSFACLSSWIWTQRQLVVVIFIRECYRSILYWLWLWPNVCYQALSAFGFSCSSFFSMYNFILVTQIEPRKYLTLLVKSDGSSYAFHHNEERHIVSLPVDVSRLTEAERMALYRAQQAKVDFGNSSRRIDKARYTQLVSDPPTFHVRRGRSIRVAKFWTVLTSSFFSCFTCMLINLLADFAVKNFRTSIHLYCTKLNYSFFFKFFSSEGIVRKWVLKSWP